MLVIDGVCPFTDTTVRPTLLQYHYRCKKYCL